MTRLIRKSDALKFVPRSRTNLNDWHLNLCRHLTLSKDPPPKKKKNCQESDLVFPTENVNLSLQ